MKTIEQETKLRDIRSENAEISKLYKLLISDFTSNECLPYFILKKNMKKGKLKASYLTDGTKNYGYVIFQIDKSSGRIHIVFFAVMKGYRSKGIGSLFLQKIMSKYRDGIVLEAKDPSYNKGEDDKRVMENRLRFYEKNHIKCVDDLKILHYGTYYRILTNSSENKNWFKFVKDSYCQLYGRLICSFIFKRIH